MEIRYLTEEEQYKEILNNEEISRIRDDELRKIREKYWRLRNEAFLDEKHISDQEIGNVHKQLIKKEQAEILLYRQRKGI